MEIFFVIVIVILVAYFFYEITQKNKELKKLYDQKAELKIHVDHLTKYNSDISQKVEKLSKYQQIIDIEEEAERILNDAQKKALSTIEKSQIHLNNSKETAKSIIENSQKQLDTALLEANKILKEAEERAKEIAGEAYDALRNSDKYQNIVKAMKNIIEGYGDEYLKPTFSLLDDLAEEFGHTEAGFNLKIARERNISLIKNELASRCDYAEARRKQIAMSFVLDAFNGKVDSILSKVKKDNYGILEQKIKDAFSLVNFNGAAFRNARITNEYLNSRIDELRWAVIVQELKWQEREEQRLIREQIREEEKARREYEKAIREAEKEESLLKKLIEKAEKEVAKASEQERASYLLRLNELELRLKYAEEKSQRALSMAQQTKAGNVYIISNIGSFGEDVFKIGMTRRLEPLDRVKELGDASVPFDFDVHAMIYSENAPQLERDLHKKFLKLQLNKINPRKEFFKVTLLDIKNAIEELGMNVKWTMIAEAKQYRESLALEEAIKRDKELEKDWLEFQEEADPITDEDLETELI